MKWAVILLSVAIVAARECIYDEMGQCLEDCPPGTVSYVSPCGGSPGTMYGSPTCAQPVPEDVTDICDMSWCGCPDSDRLWDEVQNKCVKLEDCVKVNKTGNKDHLDDNKV